MNTYKEILESMVEEINNISPEEITPVTIEFSTGHVQVKGRFTFAENFKTSVVTEYYDTEEACKRIIKMMVIDALFRH